MKKSIYGIAILLMALPFAVFATNGSVVRSQVGLVNSGDEIKNKIQEMNAARAELKEGIKIQILERTKSSATRAIVRAESRYEKIKNRINEMPNISADEKLKATEQISTDLVALNNLKEEVVLAETVEEVKSVMTKLRTTLRASKEAVRAKVDAIQATRLTRSTATLASVLERLNSKLAELKTAGTDVAGLEILASDAKLQLQEASSKILAKDFPGAKESILMARKNLIELTQDIKAMK